MNEENEKRAIPLSARYLVASDTNHVKVYANISGSCSVSLQRDAYDSTFWYARGTANAYEGYRLKGYTVHYWQTATGGGWEPKNYTREYPLSYLDTDLVFSCSDFVGVVDYSDLEFYDWGVVEGFLEVELTLVKIYSLTLSTEGSGYVSKRPNSSIFEKGEVVTVKATPAEGWVFDSWSDGGEQEHEVTIDADKTLTAIFKFPETDHILTLEAVGSGTVTGAGQYKHGTTVTIHAEPDTGWKFKYWEFSGEYRYETQDLELYILSDLTWTAYFEEKLNVTFDAQGGTCSEAKRYFDEPGEIGTLPNAEKSGYTFLGWFDGPTGGNQIDASYNVTENTTLYAHWDGAEYTLTVNPNGGVYDNSTQPVIKTPKLKTGTSRWYSIGVATRTGYTLIGYWGGEKKVYDENGHCVKGTYWSDSYANNGKYIGATDLTVRAGWRANQYTVTLDPTGGTVQPSSIVVTFDSTYGAEGSLPVPEKDGFEFEGWFTEDSGGTIVDDDTKVTEPEDHTIYAHWKEAPPPTTRVTVTFDPKGGEVTPKTKEYDSGDALTGLPVPTYAHHGFKGWFYEEGYVTRVKETDTVTSDITVYAKWGNSVGLFGYLIR